jgi:hypothetical protein
MKMIPLTMDIAKAGRPMSFQDKGKSGKNAVEYD